MTFSQNNTKHYSIQSNNSSLPSIYIDQLVAMAAAPAKTNLNPTYQTHLSPSHEITGAR
jgi:hypothetical protein